MSKTLLIVAGAVSLLAAIPLLFVGTGMVWVEVALLDDDGYIHSAPLEAEIDGYALVAGPTGIALGPELVLGAKPPLDVRLAAESRGAGADVFLGVGPSDLVNAYLGGAPHAIAGEIGDKSFAVTYRTPAEGDLAAPTPPGSESFWVASASGPGRQEISWALDDRDVTLVLMNADASDGLSLEMTVSARISVLRPVANALLLGGAAALIAGAVLLTLAF